MLIEVDNCVFDSELYKLSHGFDDLDEVSKEAFVNHIHFEGKNRVNESNAKIADWKNEVSKNWESNTFRIYRQIEDDEITIRMHMVRPGIANWSEKDIEILEF